MNLNKQTITYIFIIIFIIITFIHLYKINNKHNNNNNDKENFADLMEDQNLQGFSVSINSMEQVMFGNTPNNKLSLKTFMNEKADKTELSSLNNKVDEKASKTEVNNKVDEAMPELSVISYAGSNPPTGWQLCDGKILQFNNGTNVNPSIHTKFSSLPKKRDTNNNEMSATPDLRGRFILGSAKDEGEGLTNRVIHDTGGEETHTLTIAEMPSHNHTNNLKTTISSGSWSSSISYQIFRGQQVNASSVPNGAINNTGDDQPHNNMPPYYVLTYIIKQPSP
jgi:microcystin-dependent protein